MRKCKHWEKSKHRDKRDQRAEAKAAAEREEARAFPRRVAPGVSERMLCKLTRTYEQPHFS